MSLRKIVRAYGFRTVREVADLLNKSETTLRKWLRDEPVVLKSALQGLAIQRIMEIEL